MRTFAFTILSTVALISTALSCDEKIGKTVASTIGRDVNTLADFTRVQCLPSNDNGRCTIICVSDLRVHETQRVLLLSVLLASGGKRTRDSGLSKFENIAFMDKLLAEEKSYMVIAASKASRLQQSIVRDKPSPKEIFGIALREFVKRPLPQKK